MLLDSPAYKRFILCFKGVHGKLVQIWPSFLRQHSHRPRSQRTGRPTRSDRIEQSIENSSLLESGLVCYNRRACTNVMYDNSHTNKSHPRVQDTKFLAHALKSLPSVEIIIDLYKYVASPPCPRFDQHVHVQVSSTSSLAIRPSLMGYPHKIATFATGRYMDLHFTAV